jgi:two-component system chemotaxis response regulator CheY
MRQVIGRIVAAAGLNYDCLFAGSAREALDLLRHSTVALILTDMNMPEMNGEEFVGILRQDAVLREIPVVVLSTDSTRARMGRMAAAGVHGYLAKPFTPEDFRKVVGQALSETYA